MVWILLYLLRSAVLNDLTFKECKMTIYQVLDEQNHPVFEADSFLKAKAEAELLNYSFDDHFFFVETALKEQAH